MNTSNITNYKPKDFAELLGVSVKTLQRWDREGTLKANRTPTNRRYYTYDQYLQFKGIRSRWFCLLQKRRNENKPQLPENHRHIYLIRLVPKRNIMFRFGT